MSDSTLDLKACHAHITEKLGAEAPSYVTLRRWADLGIFNTVQDPRTVGRRPRYSTTGFLKTVRERLRQKAKPVQRSRPNRSQTDSQTPSAHPTVDPHDLQQLATQVAAMVDRQQRIEDQLGALNASLKQLDSVRQLLMLKYDAQNTTNLDLIEQLKARLKASTSDGQADMKVAIALSRLNDRVSAIQNDLQGLGRVNTNSNRGDCD